MLLACRYAHSNGQQHLEACSKTDPGAVAGTLQQLAKAGQQREVKLPCLNNDMMQHSLKRLPRSVSKDQLATHIHFTEHFGSTGN